MARLRSASQVWIVGIVVLMSAVWQRGATESMEVEGESEANLDLYVDSGDPATTPRLGAIRFYGNDDAPEKIKYARIIGEVDDATTPSRDAHIRVELEKDSVLTQILKISGSGLEVTEGTLALGSGGTAYSFPTADGTSSQILQTNAGGQVSWVEPDSHGHDSAYYTQGEVDSALAGKVAKSGDAMSGALTVNADLTVDSGTFHVDSTNNRVGVGGTTPQQQLHTYRSGANSVIRIENTGDGNYSGIEFFRQRSGGNYGAAAIWVESDPDFPRGDLVLQSNTNMSIGGAKADSYKRLTLSASSGFEFEGGDVSMDGDTASDVLLMDASEDKVILTTASVTNTLFLGQYLVMDEITPDPTLDLVDQATMFAADVAGTTIMHVADSMENVTAISPHRFELYEPAAEDPLPWTYYSENAFIGKKVNADISGALLELEALTGKKFIHVADLEPKKIKDRAAWEERAVQKRIQRAKKQDLAANPEVEIPFADAWEEVDEMVEEEVTRTVTKYLIDWENATTAPYSVDETVLQREPTGRKVRQFKAGVRFDDDTGKCYRRRTLDEVLLDPAVVEALSTVVCPQYIRDRLPQ